MTSPDDMGNGPVIRDHRRIDPVTGQVRRGKHAASQPAGASGAGRSGGPGSGGRHGRTPDGKPREQDEEPGQDDQAQAGKPEQATASGEQNGASAPAEETTGQAQSDRRATATATAPSSDDDKAKAKAGKDGDKLETALAERTADLQRLQAEYQNYRKRVERDRVAVKELAVASVLTELLPVLDAIGQARDHGELSGGFKSVADSLQGTVAKLGLVTYGEKGEPFDPKVHEALTHMYSTDVTEDTCVDILQPGYKVGDRILRAARVAVAQPSSGEDTD